MTRKVTRRAPATIAARIAEARASISALERTMAQGDNRFGSYGQNCRDAIKRHEETIARLENANV